MSERHLVWVYPVANLYEPADPAEVLAEMPTEAVLREAAKRMADRGWEHTSVLLDRQADQAGKEAAE